MITSLTATAVALAVGLPIFALGERLRERKERPPESLPQLTTPKGHPMSRYGTFTRIVHDQRSLVTAYWKTANEGGSILLEDGTFSVSTAAIGAVDPDVELCLGDEAWLEVRDGLTPNVQLTLPDGYAEAFDQSPHTPPRGRRLYWSSAIPPHGLDDPSQNPYGYGDMTLYVPESLEPLYRENGFSKWGTPGRHYLEIWEGYEPPAVPASDKAGDSGEAVESPDHYTWLGQAIAALGLSDAANVESWDVLDAAFPSDPLLWNCGKYLLRQGRKGGAEKRLEDLRKARQYLDRQIVQLSRGGE